MKAISVKQPWANLIAAGRKTIETRTWTTKYRGQLLIVSSHSPRIEPAGYALAVAEIVACRVMTGADEAAACCKVYPNAYAWELADIRAITPFPVKGRLGLYEVALPPLYRSAATSARSSAARGFALRDEALP